MLGNNKIMAFVATADAARSRHFYEQVLGLHVTSDDEFALVLNAGGTTLRVQKAATVHAPPYTSLGWEVKDLQASVRALTERGVHFERYPHFAQDELGIWHAPSGASVAWFKDPDGNLLSLAQI